jgi:UBX domain-containing protein 1
MPNIVSFSSLRNRDESKDEDNDGQGNTYYAGGNSNTGGGGSGLSVIGPGSGENADQMANIIARAQAAGRSNLEAEGSGQPRHIITFYREGFTVNNGPYRRRDDPENRPFLEAIERGYALQSSSYFLYLFIYTYILPYSFSRD